MTSNNPSILRSRRNVDSQPRSSASHAASTSASRSHAAPSPAPARTSRQLRRLMLAWSMLGCMAIMTGCGQKPEGAGASADSAATATTKAPAQGQERIVTLGGTVTEIVYALGAGPKLIGTDISSTYPDDARKLPQVGYQRTIAAEQVLSLNPTMIIASEDAGPPAAIEQLKTAGVKVTIIGGGHSVEGTRQRISDIAKVLGMEQAGQALIDSLNRDLSATPVGDTTRKARVVYVHARGGNALQVAGTGTAADAIIAIAGGANAVTSFSGYKPLTPEAALDVAPDVILVSREGFDKFGGADAIAAMPGIAQTPAARSKRIVPIDDLYVLGFGPRLGKARAELVKTFGEAVAAGGGR